MLLIPTTSEQGRWILFVHQCPADRTLPGVAKSRFVGAGNTQILSHQGGNAGVFVSGHDRHRYVSHGFHPLPQAFLRAGFMSMDPYNGHVKAYVGGVSFKPFEYDMVMLGRRQVGSTIKPFLYTMAMEEGFSPCDPVRNEPITLMTETGEHWDPQNTSTKMVGEMVNLRWGLANSNNWFRLT